MSLPLSPRPAAPATDPATWLARLDDSVAGLRELMQEHGLLSRPLTPVLLAWLAHLGLVLGGGALAAFGPGWAAVALGLVLCSLGSIGLGTVGHTASHQGASASAGWNKALFYASYPLMLQVSARYWNHSHIKIHHSSPNIDEVDPDCDLRPWFALNQAHLAQVNPLFRRWPTLQGLVFPLVLPFNGLNIQRQGWAHLLRELRTRPSAAAWADLACMVAHLGLNVGLPMLFFSPGAVLAFYLARISLTGIGLFAVLAPGHFPAQAVVLSPALREAGDLFFRQGVTTVNFRTGWLGRFLCSGLEYQIEHHMFPRISHVHLRKLSPMVRAFCARRGIPYHQLGWGEAIWASWRTFFVPKPVVVDLEGLRLQRGGEG